MISRLAVARHPMVEDYGFLIRFLVLFTVWGTVAWSFRLYINLTWTGLVMSGLFAVASTMVFIGFWTRSALVALALIVVLQGLLQHHHSFFAYAVLPLLGALLPVGRLYSLDRYLELGRKPVPYVPTGLSPDGGRVGKPLRVLFVAIVAFVVGGPAYNEIFHHHSPLFRSWDMYHTIGKNVVVLEFFRPANGMREHVDYIAVLGHKRKGQGVTANRHAMNDLRIIGTDALDGVVGRVCAAVDHPASLRIDAKIATLKRGWWRLYDGDEAICDASGRPLTKAPHFGADLIKEESVFDVE